MRSARLGRTISRWMRSRRGNSRSEIAHARCSFFGEDDFDTGKTSVQTAPEMTNCYRVGRGSARLDPLCGGRKLLTLLPAAAGPRPWDDPPCDKARTHCQGRPGQIKPGPTPRRIRAEAPSMANPQYVYHM